MLHPTAALALSAIFPVVIGIILVIIGLIVASIGADDDDEGGLVLYKKGIHIFFSGGFLVALAVLMWIVSIWWQVFI